MGQDRINREERRDMDFQKNQLLTTEIIDISTEGEGIGKVRRPAVFTGNAEDARSRQ